MSVRPSVRIDLLGAFRLTVGGESVEVPKAASRTVAWLALQSKRCSRRDLAAERLWPDLDETKARARLSQSLWTLKQRLPDALELIDASPTDLAIAVDVVVDVDELRSANAMTESPGRPVSIDWSRLASPLLEGWDDSWVVDERAVLTATLESALASQTEWLAARGELHAAVALARQRTEFLPSFEAGWRSLLSLLDQMGDVAAARSAYSRMVIAFAEFGGTPSPDLTAAHEQRIVQSSTDAAPALPDRLIGRGAERGELIKRLDVAVEGFGSVVTVCGESGIGKSRLLDELVADARWRGLRSGRAVCSEIEVPFHPLARAMEAAIAPIEVAALADTLDKPWLTRATQLLPGLAWPAESILDVAAESATTVDEDDRQVQTLVEVLLNVVQRRTVVLIIDDFQLADRWTVAAVHRVAKLCGDLGLLIVIGFRTEQMASSPHPELQRLDALEHGTRLTLGGLNQRGTYELARQLDERITRSTSEYLMEVTGGSPFLIRHVMDRVGAAGGAISAESIAAAAQDPVGEKLVDRPPLQLEALQVLAVAEESLDVFGLTKSCVGSAPESVATAVLALVSEGLVVERGGQYSIAHDRVRAAVMGDMDTASLQRVSAAVLRQRQQGGSPATEARLATRAGDWSRATRAHTSAAQQAAQLGATSAAAQHYRSAIDAGRLCALGDTELADLLIALHDTQVLQADVEGLRESLEQLGRLRLNDRWAAVTLRAGWQALDRGDASAALAAAREVIESSGNPTSVRGSAFRLRVESRMNRGQAEVGIAELRSDLDQASEATRPHRAEMLGALADAQREASSGDLGTAALTEAAELLAGDDRLDQLADTERGLGVRLIHAGETQEGFRRLHSALDSARRLGDRQREGNCVYSFGVAHGVLLDRFGRARGYLVEALRLARASSNLRTEAMVLNNLGFAEAVVLGRVGEGIDRINQGIDVAGSAGLPYWRSMCFFSRAEIAMRCADIETAAELYESAEQQLVAVGSPQPLEQVLADQAVLRSMLGDFAAAEQLLDRSLAVLENNAHSETNARVQLSFAEARILRGDVSQAAQHARAVPRNFVPGVMERHHLLWRSSVVLRECSFEQEADVLLGLAERFLHRVADDFEPRLRSEVISQHAELVVSATALARRCTVIEGQRSNGMPGGVRIDAVRAELGPDSLSSADRQGLFEQAASEAVAESVQLSRSHIAELFGIAESIVATEFPTRHTLID